MPSFFPRFLAAGLGGIDLNKRRPANSEPQKVPESLGLIVAFCFFVMSMLLSAVYLPLRRHSAALLAMCFMTLLGFADDVLTFRWRIKLVVPAAAALMLASAYPALPTQIPIVRLPSGVLWMPWPRTLTVLTAAALIIFFTNSINIYAGINGIEVGQSLVLAVGLFAHIAAAAPGAVPNAGPALVLLALFIGASLALYRFNRFPARCFVGDTYCYFAGMALVATALMTNQHLALCTLAVPQLTNFFLSVPQLVGWVPCPRHRLPRLDAPSGRMISMWRNPEGHPHLTLINLWLFLRGPLSERRCCLELLAVQVVLTVIALVTVTPFYGYISV